MKRKTQFLVLLWVCTALFPFFSRAEETPDALKTGLWLYGEGDFSGAAAWLRTVDSGHSDYREALYWTGLSELAQGNYRESLAAFESLERGDPAYRRAEIPYHKGRVFFYLGRYEEALVILSKYAEVQTDRGRKAHALYWAGESLYALGQFDRAEDVFALILEQYPESAKFEAAAYRLELVKLKKNEAELLSILRWTNEESVKTIEEYRIREKTYHQTIAAYRKRLAELEENDRETNGEAALPGDLSNGETYPEDRDWVTRLLVLKTEALSLEELIAEKMELLGDE